MGGSSEVGVGLSSVTVPKAGVCTVRSLTAWATAGCVDAAGGLCRGTGTASRAGASSVEESWGQAAAIGVTRSGRVLSTMRAAKASSAPDLVVCLVGGAGSGGFGASVTVPGFSTGPSRGGGVSAASSTGTALAASGMGRASNVRASIGLAAGREDCSRFEVFGGHPVANNWSGCSDLGETGLVTGGASRGWTAPFGCTAAGSARKVAAARCESKVAPRLAGAMGASSGATSGTASGTTFKDSENTRGGAGGGAVGAGTK